MNLKNLLGIALIVAGAALALAGFRHLDAKWFGAGCALCLVGVLLIWRRKRRGWRHGSAHGDAADLGDLIDWDGGHHSSGGSSGDHLDLPSIDFDN